MLFRSDLLGGNLWPTIRAPDLLEPEPKLGIRIWGHPVGGRNVGPSSQEGTSGSGGYPLVKAEVEAKYRCRRSTPAPGDRELLGKPCRHPTYRSFEDDESLRCETIRLPGFLVTEILYT